MSEITSVEPDGVLDAEEGPCPDVSVIIPTRNRSRLLREVLEAVWAQTIDPARMEILVMDNVSTDDTAQVMAELQEKSPCPLHYHVMPENRGPARSRNRAATLARGALLAFVDDDCRPTPEWLEHSLPPFEDPEVGLVNGTVLYKPEQTPATSFFCRITGEVREEHPTYTWSNAVYRASAFAEMDGSDESLCLADFRDRVVDCGDTDLAWRLRKAGWKNVFVPASVVYHELEELSPYNWLVDGFRMFVVAALVKRHPELRPALLSWGFVFVKDNLLLYAAVLGLLLAPFVGAAALWATVPYGIFVAWTLRASFRPARLPKFLAQMAMFAGRQAVLCAGLIYGSVRFRSLVL